MTFAEAEVVELLKGERSLKRVHFLAQRTWTCDTSEAVTGETALFFFNSLALPEPSRPRFLRSMLEFTSDSPAYRIAHSGRGRMPLRVVDGDPYATYWTEVVMPQDLPNIDGPEPEYVGFIRSAPLPLLVSKIKECTTAHGAMLRAREWRKGHDDWSWSISVWRDGRYVMEYKTLDDRKAEIAAKAPLWSCLDSDQFLAWPAAEIGTAGLDGGVELEVLAGNQLRTVRFPAPEKWNAAEFKAFEAPLRTLLEVLDSMELPKTADLRERYHAVLAKSR
ncbi:MAG TPA: hypothetical protein VM509_10970 [Planctomycetota bacterium]|nr:hypothetical protein [Planctomycetota bacterium]